MEHIVYRQSRTNRLSLCLTELMPRRARLIGAMELIAPENVGRTLLIETANPVARGRDNQSSVRSEELGLVVGRGGPAVEARRPASTLFRNLPSVSVSALTPVRLRFAIIALTTPDNRR